MIYKFVNFWFIGNFEMVFGMFGCYLFIGCLGWLLVDDWYFI